MRRAVLSNSSLESRDQSPQLGLDPLCTPLSLSLYVVVIGNQIFLFIQLFVFVFVCCCWQSFLFIQLPCVHPFAYLVHRPEMR